MPVELSRDEALEKLKNLVGQDLRKLALQYGITVFKENAGFNKGWTGLVVEHYLGLPPNSLQNPDFGDWELKVVPLKKRLDQRIVPKETMAITMINPDDVATTPFSQSHLYHKILRMIVCGRRFVDRQESSAVFERCEVFDFDDHVDKAMIAQIEKDYEDVRQILNHSGNPQKAFEQLTGKMGVYVQPRTKGRGHGSISRAFYMRKNGLIQLLKL